MGVHVQPAASPSIPITFYIILAAMLLQTNVKTVVKYFKQKPHCKSTWRHMNLAVTNVLSAIELSFMLIFMNWKSILILTMPVTTYPIQPSYNFLQDS